MITKSHFEKLKELGKLENKAGDYNRSLAFVVEEVGELAKDLVDGDTEHAKQEALDVAVAALGTYYSLGGNDRFMQRHVGKQLKKWRKALA